MAYCRQCGSVLPEGTRFCPQCGAPNSDEAARAAATQPEYSEQNAKNPKKSILKRWWFWVLVIIVACFVYGRHSIQEAQSGNEPAVAASRAPTSTQIRPEVKEFLDAYEACMDEYVAFMQRYMNADATDMVSMMGDYYSIMNRYAEFAEKLNELDQSKLTDEETAYYIDVTSRVSQKLLYVAGG